MNRIVASFALSILTPVLAAQQSLEQLERTFRDEVQKLFVKSPSLEQRDAQLQDHIRRLAAFVDGKAAGQDRWNGRLMLADLRLAAGDRDGAIAALSGIDQQDANALVLVTAATMLQHLQQRELRDAMVAAAVAKDAPLEDRMAMARLLMNVLLEVTRGEAIFRKALAAAEDDEQRAFVRWHRADALRGREDLPENTGFDELESLAEDLPDTYWGSVAKDRLRATTLKPGDDAIHFQARTTTGETFDSKQQLGKPVVISFFTAADFDAPRLIALLEQQQQRHPDLVVIGVCLDRDADEIRKSITQLGIDFPVIGNGLGPMTDAALRWFAEGPVVHVIDQQGKVAGLGLQAGTGFGRQELNEVIDRVAK